MQETETVGEDEPDNLILAHVTQTVKKKPGDLQQLVASSHKPAERPKGILKKKLNGKEEQSETITLSRNRYQRINQHEFTYHISGSTYNQQERSLLDRGANGGMAGSNVRLIEETNRTTDIVGIDDHKIQGLKLATVAGVVESTDGPVCLLMHQYAYLGKGKTIHSSGQIEHFGNDVNDKSKKVHGGMQRIHTIDGYTLPLNVRSGLAYMDMRPPTDKELDTLPQIILTSGLDWDPSILDGEYEADGFEWTDATDGSFEPAYGDIRFDKTGKYTKRKNNSMTSLPKI